MKSPDLNKNRFRYNSFFMKAVSEETYNTWRKENPTLAKKVNSFSSFSRYWGMIASGIIEEVCTNPFGVKLPYYCGELSIKYANMDLKPINKRASINNGFIVPHLNWNSSERVGKLVWNVNRAGAFNFMIKYYGFKGVRKFNQCVNKALMETPEIFKVYAANMGETLSKARQKSKLEKLEKQRGN